MRGATFLLFLLTMGSRVYSQGVPVFTQKNIDQLTASAGVAITLPAMASWINVADPAMKPASGVSVYCFFSPGNIQSVSALRQVQMLQGVQVFGVYCPKFDGEKPQAFARQSVIRYSISVPVLLDMKKEWWTKLAISREPSFLITNAQGKMIGLLQGDTWQDMLPVILEKLQVKKQASDVPANSYAYEALQEKESILYYPSAIESDSVNHRLFIAEAGHHRILIIKPDGTLLDVIGSGIRGKKTTGKFEDVEMDYPGGMAYDPVKNILYVADVLNHQILRADIKTRKVDAILGNGNTRQSHAREANFTTDPINAPTDLLLWNKDLLIAMAGYSQLWRMNLSTMQAQVFSGSGNEGLVDGQAVTAQYFQPYSLCAVKNTLYVSEAQNSALRMFDTDKKDVQSCVGNGPMWFGDKDGNKEMAMMQCAQGAMVRGGRVYVADACNNKIKAYSLAKKEVSNFIGSGKSGNYDGACPFATMNYPTDIAYLDGKFYITDCHSSLIRTCDSTGRTLSTLVLKNFSKLSNVHNAEKPYRVVTLKKIVMHPNTSFVDFEVRIDAAHRFLDDAPLKLGVRKGESAEVQFAGLTDSKFGYKMPMKILQNSGVIRFEADIYYCEKARPYNTRWEHIVIEQPFETKDEAKPICKVLYVL